MDATGNHVTIDFLRWFYQRSISQLSLESRLRFGRTMTPYQVVLMQANQFSRDTGKMMDVTLIQEFTSKTFIYLCHQGVITYLSGYGLMTNHEFDEAFTTFRDSGCTSVSEREYLEWYWVRNILLVAYNKVTSKYNLAVFDKTFKLHLIEYANETGFTEYMGQAVQTLMDTCRNAFPEKP